MKTKLYRWKLIKTNENQQKPMNSMKFNKNELKQKNQQKPIELTEANKYQWKPTYTNENQQIPMKTNEK